MGGGVVRGGMGGVLSGSARAEIACKGAGGGGEGEIEDHTEGDGGEHDASAEFGNGEHVESCLGARARGCRDGSVHLGEGRGKLGVKLGGGVKYEALKNEVDGVERAGGNEDGEASEQAKSCAKAGGDAREVEAGTIDAENNDGRRDEPEEGEQGDRRKREGEQGESDGDSSGESGNLDGAGPHDGVAGHGGLRDGLRRSVDGLLLGGDLLVDLLAQFFGELDLGSSAAPAVDEGTLIFAMKDGVAAGADALGHHFEG